MSATDPRTAAARDGIYDAWVAASHPALRQSHRLAEYHEQAGELAAIAIARADAVDTRVQQAEHERDLLGQALGEVLVALGMATDMPLTGPQLLLLADDAKTYGTPVARVQQLTDALRPFGEERVHGDHFKCEGGHGTGYVCGFDREGERIYGFTDYCRWCVARRLIDEIDASAEVDASPKEDD